MNRISAISLLSIFLVPTSVTAQDHQHHSPYAGLDSRNVRALSDEEIEGLLAGAGMEMALAAELNGYPGPRHVLELATELDLTTEQLSRTEEIFEAMAARAVMLGREIVSLERDLDSAFANGSVTDSTLTWYIDRIGTRRSALRLVHLQAHLEMRPVLIDAQRVRYNELRGYRARRH